MSSPQLERMIALEEYQALLAQLTPAQLVVVALKLDGLRQVEIAEMLGLRPSAVCMRLVAARHHLTERRPDLLAGKVRVR